MNKMVSLTLAAVAAAALLVGTGCAAPSASQAGEAVEQGMHAIGDGLSASSVDVRDDGSVRAEVGPLVFEVDAPGDDGSQEARLVGADSGIVLLQGSADVSEDSVSAKLGAGPVVFSASFWRDDGGSWTGGVSLEPAR